MAITGFGFTKIVAEKIEAAKGKISIKNNVTVKNVEKTDLALGKSKEAVLKFTFEYNSSYEPGMGNITLQGYVLDVQDEKKVDEVVNTWKKEKRIDSTVLTGIINSILARSAIQSLVLSKEVNLPPAVPLPKVEVPQLKK